jgi:hypothetical protein
MEQGLIVKQIRIIIKEGSPNLMRQATCFGLKKIRDQLEGFAAIIKWKELSSMYR